MHTQLIQGLKIQWDRVDPDSYVRQIDALKGISQLEFKRPVTFFVGENGSGKSTLLEAIAIAYGFNPEGGTKNYSFSTYDDFSDLYQAVILSKSFRHSKWGYFLRAESFYNVATKEEEYAHGGGVPQMLHEKSHGESFLDIVESNFTENSLYLLDEPEAALSPQRQLTLLAEICKYASQGSQFIIVSHSPILLGIPGAEILTFDDGPVHTCSYEETDSYQITKMFIEDREMVLEMLTDDLTRASEEDGIGNYTDSEWLYDEVREEIEKWKTLTIRCASASDLDAIESVYNRIHDAEEKGEVTTGWIRSVYPVRATAEAALRRQDLFVEKDMADGGRIVGTAIINQTQVDVYDGADWQYDAPESQVMVLHTLVIDPAVRGHGYGKAFVQFYEQYAEEHGCNYLRMDTNERNRNARSFYTRLGYREADIVPCVFNGIPDVSLVLLEKKL